MPGGDSTVTYSITTDESADQDVVQSDVRDRLDGLGDVGDIEVTASSGFGTSNDITIDVSAPDPETLQTATDSVLSTVRELPGTAEASSNLASAQPIIGVQIDRDEAAALGLSEVAVGAIVSQAVQPLQVGSIEIDNSSIDVYTVAPTPPASLDELRAVELPGPTGPVRLDSIATIDETTGPTSVTTSDAVRTATVTVTPSAGPPWITVLAVPTPPLSTPARAPTPAPTDPVANSVAAAAAAR